MVSQLLNPVNLPCKVLAPVNVQHCIDNFDFQKQVGILLFKYYRQTLAGRAIFHGKLKPQTCIAVNLISLGHLLKIGNCQWMFSHYGAAFSHCTWKCEDAQEPLHPWQQRSRWNKPHDNVTERRPKAWLVVDPTNFVCKSFQTHGGRIFHPLSY